MRGRILHSPEKKKRMKKIRTRVKITTLLSSSGALARLTNSFFCLEGISWLGKEEEERAQISLSLSLSPPPPFKNGRGRRIRHQLKRGSWRNKLYKKIEKLAMCVYYSCYCLGKAYAVFKHFARGSEMPITRRLRTYFPLSKLLSEKVSNFCKCQGSLLARTDGGRWGLTDTIPVSP